MEDTTTLHDTGEGTDLAAVGVDGGVEDAGPARDERGRFAGRGQEGEIQEGGAVEGDTSSSGDGTMVPVSALQAARRDAQNLKDTLALYQKQFQDMQSGSQQRQAAQRNDPPPIFVQDDYGDNVLNPQGLEQTIADLKSQVQAMAFMVQNPDAKSVMGELAPVLGENPALFSAFQSGNLAAIALETGRLLNKMRRQGSKQQVGPTPEQRAAAIQRNLSRPGSPGTVPGGQGGMSPGDKYSSMSPEEFSRHLSKVIARG